MGEGDSDRFDMLLGIVQVGPTPHARCVAHLELHERMHLTHRVSQWGVPRGVGIVAPARSQGYKSWVVAVLNQGRDQGSLIWSVRDVPVPETKRTEGNSGYGSYNSPLLTKNFILEICNTNPN